MSYRAIIGGEIWAGWLRRLSGWRGRVIGFFTQAAILFLILYEFPILGNMQSRAHLALATAVAVIGSTVLSLLWDALSAPRRIHLTLMEQHEKRIETLENVFNVSSTLDALTVIYDEGKTTYRTYCDPNSYYLAMDYWVRRADEFIEHHMSARELFLFRQSKHQFFSGASLIDADQSDYKLQIRRGVNTVDARQH